MERKQKNIAQSHKGAKDRKEKLLASFSFTYSLRLIAFACAFLLVLPPARAHAQTTIQPILQNGATAVRLNIVMLSEGYTSQQLPGFVSDAATILDNLLNTPPFHEYSSYFNAFAISVASMEPGSDHPASGVFRNTFFNSTFDSFGIPRLLTIPPNDYEADYAKGRGKVDSLLQLLMPEYDIVILIVNDPQFGGSGGIPAITSINPGAPEIAIHELGHSFAGLGDEYSTPFPGYPEIEEPNTTRETQRDLIKWRAWISDETPVPTPPLLQYDEVIGLFEGAHYHATGWFRPKLNCKMRTYGVDFCEVCMETLVESQYALLSPVESFSPPTTAITLDASDSASFTVAPLQPETHDLSIQWYVDGAPVSNATLPAFRVFAGDLGEGAHQVKAKVFDNTTLVRNDPFRLLSDSISWTINGDDSEQAIPGQFSLEQNYPNPFNPTTTIRFSLAEASNVRLQIYNTPGQLVKTLASGNMEAGSHSLVWDATNQSGVKVASGIYFYQLWVGSFSQVRKMVLMK